MAARHGRKCATLRTSRMRFEAEMTPSYLASLEDAYVRVRIHAWTKKRDLARQSRAFRLYCDVLVGILRAGVIGSAVAAVWAGYVMATSEGEEPAHAGAWLLMLGAWFLLHRVFATLFGRRPPGARFWRSYARTVRSEWKRACRKQPYRVEYTSVDGVLESAARDPFRCRRASIRDVFADGAIVSIVTRGPFVRSRCLVFPTADAAATWVAELTE